VAFRRLKALDAEDLTSICIISPIQGTSQRTNAVVSSSHSRHQLPSSLVQPHLRRRLERVVITSKGQMFQRAGLETIVMALFQCEVLARTEHENRVCLIRFLFSRGRSIVLSDPNRECNFYELCFNCRTRTRTQFECVSSFCLRGVHPRRACPNSS
jgi:hypothetical protein